MRESTLHYVLIAIVLIGFLIYGQRVIAPRLADALKDKLEQTVKPVKVTL